MTASRGSQGAVLSLILLVSLARPAAPAGREGGLIGWVEDTQGSPVAGAVISLFGKGIGGSGLVTLSDSAGRFVLPSLPPGSYTLRALGRGHVPAPARQITVLPNQDSIFSVSLEPLTELSEQEVVEKARELRWLIRHKRRSVVESQSPIVVAGENHDSAPRADLMERVEPLLADLAGSVEVVANPALFGADALAGETLASSRSVVRLRGRLADRGRWSLGGLVTEAESANWRMAAEFALDPGGGHEIQTGAGYGSLMLRPGMPGSTDGRASNRGVGAIFAQDRWEVGPVSTTLGGRYTFIGYLPESNHLDPRLQVQYRSGDARLRAAAGTRTLLPGGDLLTVSSMATGPGLSLAVMDRDLRPERLVHYELAVDQDMGASTLTAHTFYEGVSDQLVNVYDGAPSARSLHILNVRGLAARGVGLSLAHHFGKAVKGSISYTYGRSWREDPAFVGFIGDDLAVLTFRRADFHDIVGRLETAIDRSDTRVLVFYRVNTLSPDAEGASAITNSRFDVQLRQGLPFLGAVTRADWELLLAYRNLFYEASEGGVLDELVVSNPPKRMLGGISVRF